VQGSARVTLTGIRAEGRHGANPGERTQPQEFVVDLEVLIEVAGDSLDGTVDYRSLVELAATTVRDTSFVLLESLAGAVARAVCELPSIRETTATVHKPRAARSMGVDDVSAYVTLTA
jgi:dihydroneopterin aldolase